MKKSLVALAVGSALTLSPMVASAAKVTLYGHAQVEVGSMDISGGFDGAVVRDESRGRIGIKAKEKLGNGMTAYAKFEWKVDTTQGGRDAGNRVALVGLKGQFGAIELGNLKSAYKYSGGVKYDPFVATLLEARGKGAMSSAELGDSSFGHNSFIENSIGYKSPNFNGLSFWMTYSPDEESTAGEGGDGDYTIGLKYKNGPFEIGVAGVNVDSGLAAANGDDGDGYKVFGQYKWGNHKFSGQYENIDNNTTATEYDIWFFGWQMRAGNNSFVAQAGSTETTTAGVSSDTDYFAVGMIHHLSKHTRIFTGYRNTDTPTNETEVFSVGLRMIF